MTHSRDEAENCPIAASVSVLGDRWTLLVLRDLLVGLRRFDELMKSLGIATNILTDRLRRLEDNGLVERKAYQPHPQRFEYLPTQKGRDLTTVVMALAEWGNAWGIEMPNKSPVDFVNPETGNPLRLDTVDSVTGETIRAARARPALTNWADEKSRWRLETAKRHAPE